MKYTNVYLYNSIALKMGRFSFVLLKTDDSVVKTILIHASAKQTKQCIVDASVIVDDDAT